MTPRCSPTEGSGPDAVPRKEAAGLSDCRCSSADARNREQDAFDDYLDAMHALRRSGGLLEAYIANALFHRWLAMRR